MQEMQYDILFSVLDVTATKKKTLPKFQESKHPSFVRSAKKKKLLENQAPRALL
jgi:hypothetical protein